MTYTFLACCAVVAACVLDLVVLRTRVLARRACWTTLAIIVPFQLLSNGWLTGRRIVIYDPAVILGWRIAWAPIEDLLFGLALVVSSMAWWVWWGRRLDRP